MSCREQSASCWSIDSFRRVQTISMPVLIASLQRMLGTVASRYVLVAIVFRREFLPAVLRCAATAPEISRSSFPLARL
jgi:hypothetical protein